MICALKNLGSDHLARQGIDGDKVWESYFRGLEAYLMSLVAEYGKQEDEAERELVAEINTVRNCIC